MGLSRQEAEDLAQESLLRAHMHAPNLPLDELGRWLHVVHKRIVLNVLRTPAHQATKSGVSLDDSDGLYEPQVPSNQDDAVFLKEVMIQLERLPDRAQRLIRNISLGGHSYEEAAKAEGIEIGTVRSALHRATDALKQRLARPSRARQIAA